MRRRSHRSRRVVVVALVAMASLTVAGSSSGTPSAGAAAKGCARAKHKARVAAPRFVRHIATGETGLVLLARARRPRRRRQARDRRARLLDLRLRRQRAHCSARARRPRAASTRPAVVADLDGDGVPEIVVGGNEGTVAAYDLRRRPAAAQARLAGVDVQRRPVPRRRAAWRRPTSTATAGSRSWSTTTNTSPTRLAGLRLRRRGQAVPARGGDRAGVAALQPLPGPGNDADFNGVGNHGYGAYGENVGIGNLDDDPQLEIVVTFDNHQINVFNHDGTSVLASPWFTNRQNDHLGARLGWGQFIRWLSPTVEARPLPPPRRPVAGRAQDALAAVDGLAAVGRRPRRRRAQRGHRAARTSR